LVANGFTVALLTGFSEEVLWLISTAGVPDLPSKSDGYRFT